jgi:arylsulfatase A-like enzyme
VNYLYSEGIKNLTLAAINDLGNNTVIIFSSDNGGSQWFGGINYPLKGILCLFIIFNKTI